VFKSFERLVPDLPGGRARTRHRSASFAFLWACTEGLRPLSVRDDALTATIGAFEALLFAMLGHIVDWLATVEPARCGPTSAADLLLLAACWREPAGRCAAGAAQVPDAVGNFPMLLRWNFHR
jgi:ATP-binding cassette subfamily B multidrug efflux pump